MHDGPGPAEGLADVRPDPACPRVGAVTQFHGGGRHPAGDGVQRLPLYVGIQPDPLPGQRFAQQRELVPGRVDHVDADVAVVLDHGLHPADAQVPGRGGHHHPVPAVDERQAFLGNAVLEHPRRGDLLGQRDRRLRAGLADVRVHVAGVRETPADVLARLGRRDELHPGTDLDRERQRIGVVQPRLAIGKGHHIGEPGEGDKGGIRFAAHLLQAQHGPPVVDLSLEQGVDLPRAPPPALGRGRHRLARRRYQRVLDQPGDLAGGRVPRRERAGVQRPAEPFGRLGPLADLRAADRLVDEPEPPLTAAVRGRELRQHPAGQLGAHAPLAEPDPQVDFLGPEILGPDVLVGLLQVLPPARAAVRRRVQARRPGVRRVRPVRDAQVDLGVRHPDRGQRDGDVRRQRLPLLRGGELVGDRGHPVVRPGVGVGQQNAVIEVPDAQPGLRSP